MTRMAIKMTSLFSRLNAILLAIFILIATLLCWSGIPGVPFHPDESTQLFMSADFDLFLASPLSDFITGEAININGGAFMD